MKTKQIEARNGRKPASVNVEFNPTPEVQKRLERLAKASGRTAEDLARECVQLGVERLEVTEPKANRYEAEVRERVLDTGFEVTMPVRVTLLQDEWRFFCDEAEESGRSLDHAVSRFIADELMRDRERQLSERLAAAAKAA